MIVSLLSTPATKNLIANMPIVILFKALRGALGSRSSKATRPLQGNQPSATFR